jgi:RNA polymerase sigma factor (sigma-70 family)
MTVIVNNEEAELIRDILAGDKKRYELLMRRYNQRLYRVGKSILWKDEDVEDAMQEAYIKAYQQLPKFEARSAFGTWLTRILINECLMKKRQQRNKAQTGEYSEEQVNRIPAEMIDPEKKIVNKELGQLLEQTIAGLPEKYRVVFVMREIENMSVSETTQLLDITETNVKARLSRAKEMLRNAILSNYPVRELLEFNLVRCDRIVENVFARIP